MKRMIPIFLSSLLLSAFSLASPTAATETAKNTAKNVETKNEETKKKETATTTSHQFEDLLVQGKYHFSDEAVTTVEEDKVLDALIGVRSDFKDRLKKSMVRH